MIKRPNTKAQRIKRHKRVRSKISGTPERPRLSVYRSENNIYAQIIDDVAGHTLCSASSVEKGLRAAATSSPRSRSARQLPSAPSRRASRKSSVTAAATSITAAFRPWLTAPARAA